MPTLSKSMPQSDRAFAVIDDGNWRGIIAPKSYLSPKRLSMLVDDLEDTDPKFLSAVHKEYKQAKANGLLITSARFRILDKIRVIFILEQERIVITRIRFRREAY